MLTERHFAWFNIETGAWIGEWAGRVPAPTIPVGITGTARIELLNAWVQRTQRAITPGGSCYHTVATVWNLDAWDDCPMGGAVCLDVTMYRWPVGDFFWSVFDGVDRIIDFRESRAFLQLSTDTLRLDASVRSARPVRSTRTRQIGDITGTPLEPWMDRLFGQFAKRDGRLVFEPLALSQLPETVVLSLTDRNPDIHEWFNDIDHERVPHAALA